MTDRPGWTAYAGQASSRTNARTNARTNEDLELRRTILTISKKSSAVRTRCLMLLMTVCLLGAAAGDALAQAQPVPCPADRRARYPVRIDSVPPQASVIHTTKNCLLGVTPWTGKLENGNVSITVTKEGYEPSMRSITVRRTRRQQDHMFALVKKPDPPKVEVRADADNNVFNAQVFIDGQNQGQVPALVQVTEGRHLVEIRKEGFVAFSQWVEVKEGDRVTLNPVLKAVEVEKKGMILVEADVPEAEVYIDGNKHTDLTPTLLRDVVEGPHVIEVRKEPAMPWKQTVMVMADQTVKVSAQLEATMKGPTGTIRVLSNVQGARVYLDGVDLGPVPIDIKDAKPGEHVVEVKAEGYLPREERVTVSAGSAAVLKLDMQPEAAVKETGVLKIVSPVPEGEVFVDGERVGNVPQEKEIPPGDHFVVVTKAGYKKFEQKVRLEAGQTITVTADLAAVGALRVLSTPMGAEVLVDGEPVGNTPLNLDDVDVGDHVVNVRAAEHYDFEQQIKIDGGQRTIVSAKLEMIDTGPTVDDLQREQRGLSSFGARALPLGRSTIDFSASYPYFAQGQFTVGAGRLGGKAFDAGVFLRTFLARTELGVRGRLTAFDKEPFSFGFFAALGGGSNFIDESGRNSLFLDGGALASLTAFGSMTVTGRAYLNIWSDRHCPPDGEGDAIDICNVNAYSNNKARVDELIGGSSFAALQDRENGVRLMLSLIVEVALHQRWSAWLLFEGAPFQKERAAYTSLFSGTMLDDDIGTYLHLGGTFKF